MRYKEKVSLWVSTIQYKKGVKWLKMMPLLFYPLGMLAFYFFTIKQIGFSGIGDFFCWWMNSKSTKFGEFDGFYRVLARDGIISVAILPIFIVGPAYLILRYLAPLLISEDKVRASKAFEENGQNLGSGHDP